MDWSDDLWTQETVDDWEPDNDPEELDLLAADALFDMIINGMDMTSERMRSTVVLLQTQSNDSRQSKILDDGELNQVVDGIGYVDQRTDEEMKEFIAEIISAITTGDEEEDMQSIDTFAQTIAAQQNVTREQARENLIQLRKEFFELRKQGKDEKQATTSLTYKIYKGGILAC